MDLGAPPLMIPLKVGCFVNYYFGHESMMYQLTGLRYLPTMCEIIANICATLFCHDVSTNFFLNLQVAKNDSRK
jgi:hypothetical protein